MPACSSVRRPACCEVASRTAITTSSPRADRLHIGLLSSPKFATREDSTSHFSAAAAHAHVPHTGRERCSGTTAGTIAYPRRRRDLSASESLGCSPSQDCAFFSFLGGGGAIGSDGPAFDSDDAAFAALRCLRREIGGVSLET